jgi:hypothetical protein
MIILIKLILAHLIGDFILQPTSWVKAKEKNKLKAYQLYLHALVHGILIMLLVWDWAFLKWAILLTGIHLFIDAIKLLLQKDKTKRVFFFADQFTHVLSIYLLFCAYMGFTEINASLFNEANFLLATMLLFLTTPTSYIISMFIARWAPHTEEASTDSLQDAGKFIGILERLLIFVFVITGRWEAVGFLLAAKSIFRFGDLKKPKDRKLTEYILIGTLLSFGLAILTAMTYTALRPQ